jgi:hypothetical protein
VRTRFGAEAVPCSEKKARLAMLAADASPGCRVELVAYFGDAERSSGDNDGKISDECHSCWSGIANQRGASYCNPDHIGAGVGSRLIETAAFG